MLDSAETPRQPEKKKEFEPWGEVTDPRHHNSEKYRYLVHAINPFATSSMLIAGLNTSRYDAEAINPEDGDQKINLFSEPERISERVSLSCSLIDQNHNSTWAEVGLIVESPPKNVIITSPTDVGAIGNSKVRLLEQARKHSSYSAEQLLQLTNPHSYNEVDVLANHEGKKVHLSGFVYKALEDGSPKNEAMYQQMSVHADRLSLPLIPIIEPNPYKENKITKTDEQFTVQFGGKLYNLHGSSSWQFKALGQDLFQTFTSPDEIEQVFTYLRGNNVEEAEISQFRTAYQEADRARQQPRVFYDEQGNIGRIEKMSGYGKDERRMNINSHDARSVNLFEAAMRLSAQMADPMRSETQIHRFRDLASPYEAEQVVQEAIRNAPENEREKISQWWLGAKDGVDKQWELKLSQEERLSRYLPKRKDSSPDKFLDLSSLLNKYGLKDKSDEKGK